MPTSSVFVSLLLVFLEFSPPAQCVRQSIMAKSISMKMYQKNGADLIFFGSNVHTGSKIEDAAKTASALAKAWKTQSRKVTLTSMVLMQ